METVTLQDLLDALVTASSAPEEAQTVDEISAATGVNAWGVRRALKKYQMQGRLRLHHVPRETISGRSVMTPAYTIAPEPKAKSKR